VFIVVAIPGLILGFLIWRVIREPATVGAHAHVARAPVSEIIKHKNVPLSMIGLMCAMSGIFVLSAMAPNYLVDYLKLDLQQMGFVTSAIGFGGFLGQVVLPGASDVVGRKTIAFSASRWALRSCTRSSRWARIRRCCSCCCSRARSSASACSG
jgi:predicted MFS family arabinose efflux permease